MSSPRKCVTCGAIAKGTMKVGGADTAFCPDHLPREQQRRRYGRFCLAALLRGEARGKARAR